MEMYQDDYIRRNNDEYEKINYTAWMHGQYIIPAIQVALSPKKVKYPKTPYDKSDDDDEQPSEAKTIIQSRKFEDWADVWNKKFINKQGA